MSTASGLSTEDLASNLLGTKGGGGLEAFFAPQNVAVIGATERAGSIGHERKAQRIELGLGQGVCFGDGLAHCQNEPVGRSVKDQPHLIGSGRAAGGAVAFETVYP